MTTHPIQRLAKNVPYIKFMGMMMIITGGLTALTIVGLLWAWLPIWMGIVLWTGGQAIRDGVNDGDDFRLELGCGRIGLYFKVMAIVMIIGVILQVLFLFTIFAAM